MIVIGNRETIESITIEQREREILHDRMQAIALREGGAGSWGSAVSQETFQNPN